MNAKLENDAEFKKIARVYVQRERVIILCSDHLCIQVPDSSNDLYKKWSLQVLVCMVTTNIARYSDTATSLTYWII